MNYRRIVKHYRQHFCKNIFFNVIYGVKKVYYISYFIEILVLVLTHNYMALKTCVM